MALLPLCFKTDLCTIADAILARGQNNTDEMNRLQDEVKLKILQKSKVVKQIASMLEPIEQKTKQLE